MAPPPLSPVPYLAAGRLPRGQGPVRHDHGPRLPQTTADPPPGSTRSGPPGPVEPPPVPHPQPPPRPQPPHPAPPPWPPPRPQPEPPAPPGPRRRRPLPAPEPEPEPEPIPPPAPPPEPCRRRHSRHPGPLPDFPAPAEYPRVFPATRAERGDLGPSGGKVVSAVAVCAGPGGSG